MGDGGASRRHPRGHHAPGSCPEGSTFLIAHQTPRSARVRFSFRMVAGRRGPPVDPSNQKRTRHGAERHAPPLVPVGRYGVTLGL